MDFFKCSLSSCLLLLIVCSIRATPVNDLSKGMDEFATDLYLQCAKDKPGNIIVSPLSVSSALALLSQAADADTYDQLKQGLHLSNDKSTVADQFLEHRSALERNAGKATFSIANRIYVQQGHQLNKNFEEVAASKFKSGIESLNFVESAKSAAAINHFVEENTNGKIKDLFKPDQFDLDTRSVLVNAIYFKGNWEKPFNKDFTSKRDFYNSGTDKVSVDFMFKDSRFNSARLTELDATALELKYANSSMAFVFVLPNSKTGLSEMETKLKDFDLANIGEKLQPSRYMTSIPKFKVEFEVKLKDTLKKLGMTDIFTEQANLRGLLETGEQLKITDVIHKAFLEVDENGSEAGGATGMEVVAMSLPPSFTADHPFMFFIRDTETNTIIFNGRIEKL